MKHTQNWPDGYETHLEAVIQGEFLMSDKADVALSTVLGSCAAVCLYDTRVGVGGMNHYLLATSDGSDRTDMKYGAHAMELLINNLLKAGANRDLLQAKVFGGSTMTGRFGNIGRRNTDFAIDFLSDEGIPIVGKDIGGSAARRVNFHPVTGKARVIHTEATVNTFEAEARKTREKPKPATRPVLF